MKIIFVIFVLIGLFAICSGTPKKQTTRKRVKKFKDYYIDTNGDIVYIKRHIDTRV